MWARCSHILCVCHGACLHVPVCTSLCCVCPCVGVAVGMNVFLPGCTQLRVSVCDSYGQGPDELSWMCVCGGVSVCSRELCIFKGRYRWMELEAGREEGRASPGQEGEPIFQEWGVCAVQRIHQTSNPEKRGWTSGSHGWTGCPDATKEQAGVPASSPNTNGDSSHPGLGSGLNPTFRLSH